MASGLTEKEASGIVDEYRAGTSVRQIRRMFGIREATFYRVLWRAGVVPRGRGGSDGRRCPTCGAHRPGA